LDEIVVSGSRITASQLFGHASPRNKNSYTPMQNNPPDIPRRFMNNARTIAGARRL
jgi:hypothetical protein